MHNTSYLLRFRRYAIVIWMAIFLRNDHPDALCSKTAGRITYSPFVGEGHLVLWQPRLQSRLSRQNRQEVVEFKQVLNPAKPEIV